MGVSVKTEAYNEDNKFIAISICINQKFYLINYYININCVMYYLIELRNIESWLKNVRLDKSKSKITKTKYNRHLGFYQTLF